MKTIMVLSDTHGNMRALASLGEIIAETDYIVHLGDHSRDAARIRERWPEKTYVVDGNCDVGFHNECTFIAEDKKVLAVHGHKFGVKSGLTALSLYAKEKGFDLVLFGHTHEAACIEDGGIVYVNPGSLSIRERHKSYAYIVIHGGKCECKIVPYVEKI